MFSVASGAVELSSVFRRADIAFPDLAITLNAVAADCPAVERTLITKGRIPAARVAGAIGGEIGEME
jgi:hypothetical protein